MVRLRVSFFCCVVLSRVKQLLEKVQAFALKVANAEEKLARVQFFNSNGAIEVCWASRKLHACMNSHWQLIE
ncbi:hypothetical protein D3C73_1574120 [compost metagenome]